MNGKGIKHLIGLFMFILAFAFFLRGMEPPTGTGQEHLYAGVTAPVPSGWGTPTVVSTESTLDSYFPSLAVDGDGNVHVAWQDLTNYSSAGTDTDIFYKYRNATSGAWSNTEVVSTESTWNSQSPTLALDGAGNVHVAWFDYTNYGGSGDDRDIFYKYRNATSGAWSITEVVSTESTLDSYYHSLAVDGAGNVHVAWDDPTNYNSSGTDTDIFYKYRDATSGTWSITEVVSTESTGTSSSPSLVVDVAGNVHVTWDDPTNYGSSGADRDIFYKYRNATSGTWSITEVVSTESTLGSYSPSLVVDGAWDVHIAWYDYTNYGGCGTDTDLFYKRYTNATCTWGTTIVVSTESTGSSTSPSLVVDGAGNVHVAWPDTTNYTSSGTDADIFYKRIKPPTVSTPADMYYALGTTGHSITWVANDTATGTRSFSVYRNGSLHATGSWNSTEGITIGIDGLSLGWHNFTIVVDDGLGSTATNQVWVFVQLAPSITSPPDIAFVVGTTGHVITWTVTDATTASTTYTITKSGTQVDQGPWAPGTGITFILDGLAQGDYEFTITVDDGYGGTASDTVLVRVLPASGPDLPPGLMVAILLLAFAGASVLLGIMLRKRSKKAQPPRNKVE